MEKNPAFRVLAAIGAPFGWTRQPSEPGIAKRKRLRKIARKSRRANLHR